MGGREGERRVFLLKASVESEMGLGVPRALNVIRISVPPSQPSLQFLGSLSSLGELLVLGTDYRFLGLQIKQLLISQYSKT